MRKWTVMAAALLAVCTGFAAELGDTVRPLNFKYLANDPGALKFDYDGKDPQAPGKYILIDFFGSYLPSGGEQSDILNAVAALYAGKGLTVIAASGEPEDKLAKYLAATPKVTYAVARDNGDAVAQRVIPGDMLLPVCAIIDGRGVLQWIGDTSEVPDALERLYNGTYKMDSRAKILPLYSQLASALRGGSANEVKVLTDRMLKLEPWNITAAQARLFICETTGDFDGGWEFLNRQLKAVPDLPIWYWLAVGYGSRNPAYRDQVLPVVERFLAIAPKYRMETVNMAWELINSYGFNYQALNAAERLLGTVAASDWRERAARALVAYKRCNLAQAVALQREAVNLARAAGVDQEQQAELVQVLDFLTAVSGG